MTNKVGGGGGGSPKKKKNDKDKDISEENEGKTEKVDRQYISDIASTILI